MKKKKTGSSFLIKLFMKRSWMNYKKKSKGQVVVDFFKGKKICLIFLKNIFPLTYYEKICIAFSTSSGVSGFISLLETQWAKIQKKVQFKEIYLKFFECTCTEQADIGTEGACEVKNKILKMLTFSLIEVIMQHNHP